MKCIKCRVELSEFRSVMSKYCSRCRDLVRKEANAKNRVKIKLRRESDPIFQAKDQFKKYRQRSPSRGLVFELTEDDFVNSVDEVCYYCGDAYHGIGFDRVDNSVGYIVGNVVSCCPDCNRMKHTFGIDKFVDMCKKIARNFS